MTEPWEWTQQDLLNLLANRVQENLNLDYKRKDSLDNSDRNKVEISKDVSAFANSDGGTIVYGMEEKDHLPVRLDGLDPTVTTKEWIEQVINSKIRPRVDGVRINPVPLAEPLQGTAYVVHVPASTRAAHMASDHRHYKRFNFESVPMEHYELEDVRRRRTGPLLSLGLTQVRTIRPNHAIITFELRNSSSTMALYSLLLIKVEGGTLPPQSPDAWSSVSHYEGGMLLQKAVAVPERLPIWESIPLSLGASAVVICPDHSEFCMDWNLHSPDMAPQAGIFWFHAVNGEISEIEDDAIIQTLNDRRAAK